MEIAKSQTTMKLNWLYWIKTAGYYELNVPRKAIGNFVSSNIEAHNMWKRSFYNNNWQGSKAVLVGRPFNGSRKS